MPGAAWLPPRGLGALSESSAKLVAPATDRFVRDHDATLEQQLLDVAQTQAEPEVPANGAADDDSRETVAVIKRFGLLHRFILPPHLQQPDSAGLPYPRQVGGVPNWRHNCMTKYCSTAPHSTTSIARVGRP